jgi:hypothetical protein
MSEGRVGICFAGMGDAQKYLGTDCLLMADRDR